MVYFRLRLFLYKLCWVLFISCLWKMLLYAFVVLQLNPWVYSFLPCLKTFADIFFLPVPPNYSIKGFVNSCTCKAYSKIIKGARVQNETFPCKQLSVSHVSYLPWRDQDELLICAWRFYMLIFHLQALNKLYIVLNTVSIQIILHHIPNGDQVDCSKWSH